MELAQTPTESQRGHDEKREIVSVGLDDAIDLRMMVATRGGRVVCLLYSFPFLSQAKSRIAPSSHGLLIPIRGFGSVAGWRALFGIDAEASERETMLLRAADRTAACLHATPLKQGRWCAIDFLSVASS